MAATKITFLSRLVWISSPCQTDKMDTEHDKTVLRAIQFTKFAVLSLFTNHVTPTSYSSFHALMTYSKAAIQSAQLRTLMCAFTVSR